MQSLKIDLAKLNGAKPFTARDGTAHIAIPIEANYVFVGKNGAHYLELMMHDKPNDYGDGFAALSIPKALREAGEKGPIIGNWKHIGKGRDVPASEAKMKQPAGTTKPDDDCDSMPF